MVEQGYHGTERYIANRILTNHSWTGFESYNELGYGLYFYTDDDFESAKSLALRYPMGVRKDGSDKIVAMQAKWKTTEVGFYIDLDDEYWVEFFYKFKNKSSNNPKYSSVRVKNDIQLQGLLLADFCNLLSKNDKKVILVSKTINLPNSYLVLHHPIERGMCVCVYDKTVLHPPEG